MDVVAPQKVDGAVVFASWKGQEMALQENSLLSPLEFLLPQRDVLFRYTQDSGRYSFAEPSAKFRLIFGIRSCDLCAVAALDKIFGSAPADHPYFEKRRSTVLVALNCTRPAESCSCSSSGSGPECRDLFDLLLTEVRDGYLAETGSAAGIMILKEHPDMYLEIDRRVREVVFPGKPVQEAPVVTEAAKNIGDKSLIAETGQGAPAALLPRKPGRPRTAAGTCGSGSVRERSSTRRLTCLTAAAGQ